MMWKTTLHRCNVMIHYHFKQVLLKLLSGALFTVITGIALAQTAWPTIALPKDAKSFDVGDDIKVNGLSMRMQGFVCDSSPSQIAEWFRQSLGKPLVESALGNKLILGRLQGTDYLTIQLEPVGKGTRGVVAVSHLKAAYDGRAESQANKDRWLSRLPSDSRLISFLTSEDQGKVSSHLVITNSQSVKLNRDRLKNLLSQDDFEFQRESADDENSMIRLPGGAIRGQTLYFKALGKEAMATISRDTNGNTTIVLNIITKMERFK